MIEMALAAAKRGDKEAFFGLIEPLEARLYQTALGIVGTRQDAEDVWQSTVLQAWRNIRQLREPHFKTWVTRILINEAKQVLRKGARLPQPREFVPEIASEDIDVPSKLLVHALLQDLPHEQREVIILRFWLDLSLQEIAETVHAPLSTAKTRLYQGLANLKHRLKEGD